jgi:hypothetical protein
VTQTERAREIEREREREREREEEEEKRGWEGESRYYKSRENEARRRES